jgi:hypothetical protein
MRSIKSKVDISSTRIEKEYNKGWKFDQDILMGKDLRKKAYKEGRKSHKR